MSNTVVLEFMVQVLFLERCDQNEKKERNNCRAPLYL